MPKKLLAPAHTHSLIQERLLSWGRAIQAQRLRTRVTAADLSQRIGVSVATLARLERGDPGVGAGAYLTALLALGILDSATPPLPAAMVTAPQGKRVRLSATERGDRDDEYF